MISHILNHLNHLPMTTVEPGMDPGKGLTFAQTFLIFVVTPVGLFLGITSIVLLSSRPKKK